jgi:hypothetical protein
MRLCALIFPYLLYVYYTLYAGLVPWVRRWDSPPYNHYSDESLATMRVSADSREIQKGQKGVFSGNCWHKCARGGRGKE